MQTRASSIYVQLIQRLIDASKNWFGRIASVNEIAALEDSEELSHIAHELGISPAELRVLAKHDEKAADLLYKRMDQLRLDRNHIDISVLRDLQRCCSNCDLKQLCAHELEDKPIGATWPKYCPNEQTLSSLASEPKRPKAKRR
ncbi:MAG TPA: DUF6455 family protein [Stellaceae bacterium]|nr:DUF6455 family protein [Stellaceae bacterium]